MCISAPSLEKGRRRIGMHIVLKWGERDSGCRPGIRNMGKIANLMLLQIGIYNEKVVC